MATTHTAAQASVREPLTTTAARSDHTPTATTIASPANDPA